MPPQPPNHAKPQSSEAAKLDLLATPVADLQAAAQRWFGQAKGAGFARRIHRQAVCDGVFDPAILGAGPRATSVWQQHANLNLPTSQGELREACDHGETQKRLLQFDDGRSVESVSLPMGHGRRSLCVSTQVGCARACTFCETGRMGLLRNLSAGEIVAQVTMQRRTSNVDQIVFQGMGEPLDNLDALLPAMHVLTDPSGLGLAHDRLTVCTVGHVPGIDALRQLGWKRLGLSLSLNSADDERRGDLMPNSVRYPLRDIQASLIAYRQRKNLALGVHWCLLPGINDTERDADQIAKFIQPLGRTFVHVIPFNPGTEPITRAPHEHEVIAFVSLLRNRGIAVRRRITKGRSVMAGCGQLSSAQT